MANGQTQVSAFISDSTKDALEQYAEAHGLKKAFLIEEALLHHLQALRELPLDVIIPVRLVVSRDSGEALVKSLGIRRGMKVLDLGCGDGTTALPAASNFEGRPIPALRSGRDLVREGRPATGIPVTASTTSPASSGGAAPSTIRIPTAVVAAPSQRWAGGRAARSTS